MKDRNTRAREGPRGTKRQQMTEENFPAKWQGVRRTRDDKHGQELDSPQTTYERFPSPGARTKQGFVKLASPHKLRETSFTTFQIYGTLAFHFINIQNKCSYQRPSRGSAALLRVGCKFPSKRIYIPNLNANGWLRFFENCPNYCHRPHKKASHIKYVKAPRSDGRQDN